MAGRSITTPDQDLIDHLFDSTVTVTEEETFVQYRQTRSKAIVSCAATRAGSGDSRFHQDWCALGTLVLALCYSAGSSGDIGLKKLSPEYLHNDATDTKFDKYRHTSIVQEVRIPCAGPQGTAMSLTSDENFGWLHGTFLRLLHGTYVLRAISTFFTRMRGIVTCYGLTNNNYCTWQVPHHDPDHLPRSVRQGEFRNEYLAPRRLWG